MDKNVSESRLQAAERLRNIRKNAGYSQESFAELLDLSVSAYKKIESGESGISIKCLMRLYKELEVSADYLLFGESLGVNALWGHILNCTEEDKMALLLMLLQDFNESPEIDRNMFARFLRNNL